MRRLKKYGCLLLLLSIGVGTFAQNLCEKEYRIINKQKRKLKQKTKKIAQEWLAIHKDSLNLPDNLKLSRLKFLHEEKEEQKWHSIDSLFCVKGGDAYIEKGKQLLIEKKLVVYDIRTSFDFANSSNPLIKSVLNFEYDFNGNLIRAIVRQKEMSPFSETPIKKK